MKRYNSLYLNCSTDQRPIDSAANLIINDVYYTSIRLVNGKCFSTDLERECLPGICDCSGESLWFSHFYNVTQTSVVDISCSMIFGIHGTFSSRIQVKIIGNYIYIYIIYMMQTWSVLILCIAAILPYNKDSHYTGFACPYNKNANMPIPKSHH